MKRVLLFLLAISASSLLVSQDYQAFRSDREGLYREFPDEGPIKGVRVIQVQAGPDSIFHFNPNIRELDSNCMSPLADNWLGATLRMRANGDHVFRNLLQDSILIKTQATVGEHWLAYRSHNDSVRVYASLISHDTLTHLGLLDSVKTFQFQATNQDSAFISLPANQLQLVIGKELGLLFTPNFALFPDLVETNSYTPDDFPTTYQLLGLTLPDIGLSNLTWLQVHDFQAGNELHVVEEDFDPLFVFDYFHQITETIFRYLDRFEQGDSLGYQVDIEKEFWDFYEGTTYSRDTMMVWYTPDPEFDKLPSEPAIIDSLYQPSNLRREGNILLKEFDAPAIGPMVDSCSLFLFDFVNYDEYWKGLGGPYYFKEGYAGVSFSKRELKYYRKGTETWGTPFLLTSIEDPFDQTSIQVFPNPTSGEVTVSVEAGQFRPDFSLILRDVQGRELIRFPLDTPKEQLDLTSWSQGVYLYEIRDEEGLLAKRGKLVLKY